MATFNQYKDKKTGVKKWEWRGYVCTDPNTGKKVVSAHKGFNTKRDAVKDFEDTKRKITDNDFSDSDLTFKELFDKFISFKMDRVKENTIFQYKKAIRLMIEKEIIHGDKKIKSFNVPYATFVFDKLNANYKGQTKRTFFTYIKSVFNFAVKNEYIKDNPFNKVDTQEKYNKIEEKKINTLNRDELKKLLEVASEDNRFYYVLFHLLAFTGMRQGEARALRWSDIDFKENTISITKTVTMDINGKTIIGNTPKTKSSHRVIKMDSNTANILKHYRDECRDYYSKRGKLFDFIESFVFADGKGSFISSCQLRKYLNRYIKRSGVTPITVHGLRHTYVSLMIEAGIQPIEIAHNVGHGDLKMIMSVYDEMTQSRKEKTADTFAQFMAK